MHQMESSNTAANIPFPRPGESDASSSAAASASGHAPTWKLIPLWFIVALIVSSPVIGAAVINAHMAVALKMDRTVLGAGISLFVALMSLSAPCVALGFRFFGIRNVALAGVTLAMIGAILMATVVSSGPSFILSYGLVIGLGVGASGVLPVQTIVATWFRNRRALAVSVILSAIDISGVVTSPAYAWLIDKTGSWRDAWWVTLGCFVVAGLLILWMIPRNLSADPHSIDVSVPVVDREASRTRVYKTPTHWPIGEAMRTRPYVYLLLYSLTTCIVWVFFLSHGIEHLHDIGYSSTSAATALSIIVAASLAGNAAAGLLGDRIPPHLLGAGAMLMLSAGLALAIAPSGFAALAAFGIVFGFGYGAGQVCWITTLTNYFGTKAFPILYGVILATGMIGGTIGGMGAGSVYDRLHTYGPAFAVGVALTTLIGLLQLLASPKSIKREHAMAGQAASSH
ncbi:MFS transporter [Paraburkholderia sp. J67]|uniref:MFS transporter n=1 Tax=Paraburkholderia sp. J67 TaxID=2805435 RepID=UPI002ABDB204|nr:MFS transporter [Paraburkholderia sp. J67]